MMKKYLVLVSILGLLITAVTNANNTADVDVHIGDGDHSSHENNGDGSVIISGGNNTIGSIKVGDESHVHHHTDESVEKDCTFNIDQSGNGNSSSGNNFSCN